MSATRSTWKQLLVSRETSEVFKGLSKQRDTSCNVPKPPSQRLRSRVLPMKVLALSVSAWKTKIRNATRDEEMYKDFQLTLSSIAFWTKVKVKSKRSRYARIRKEVEALVQKQNLVDVVEVDPEPPLTKQYDPDLYTDEMLDIREKLRKNARVQEELKECSRPMPKMGDGTIGKQTYLKLCMNILAEMLVVISEKEAQRIAEDDWISDSQDGIMTIESFEKGMFELADVWCESVEEEEYTEFLSSLRKEVLSDEKLIILKVHASEDESLRKASLVSGNVKPGRGRDISDWTTKRSSSRNVVGVKILSEALGHQSIRVDNSDDTLTVGSLAKDIFDDFSKKFQYMRVESEKQIVLEHVGRTLAPSQLLKDVGLEEGSVLNIKVMDAPKSDTEGNADSSVDVESKDKESLESMRSDEVEINLDESTEVHDHAKKKYKPVPRAAKSKIRVPLVRTTRNERSGHKHLGSRTIHFMGERGAMTERPATHRKSAPVQQKAPVFNELRSGGLLEKVMLERVVESVESGKVPYAQVKLMELFDKGLLRQNEFVMSEQKKKVKSSKSRALSRKVSLKGPVVSRMTKSFLSDYSQFVKYATDRNPEGVKPGRWRTMVTEKKGIHHRHSDAKSDIPSLFLGDVRPSTPPLSTV